MRFIEPRACLIGAELVDEAPALPALRRLAHVEKGRAVLDDAPVHRLACEKLAAHRVPLGALAAEHEDDLGTPFGRTDGDAGCLLVGLDRCPLREVPPQPVYPQPACASHHGEPARKVTPTQARGVRDVVDAVPRARRVAKAGRQRIGQQPEGPRAVRGQGKNALPRGGVSWGRPQARRRQLRAQSRRCRPPRAPPPAAPPRGSRGHSCRRTRKSSRPPVGGGASSSHAMPSVARRSRVPSSAMWGLSERK